MKSFKIFLAVLLLFVLCFSVISCGKATEACEHTDKNKDNVCDTCQAELKTDGGGECKSCIDTNGDNLCDNCNKEISKEPEAENGMVLVENYEAYFRFVTYDDMDLNSLQTLRELAAVYSDFGMEIDVITENNNSEFDGIEILVGPVKTRGEKYAFDMYSLGKEGYVVKAVDDKILLTSGSPETLQDLIKAFFEDYLGYEEGDAFELPENIMISESEWKEEIQDDYRITSLSINGNDIRDYIIAYDSNSPLMKEAAEAFQDSIYEKVGVYLPMRRLEDLSEDELRYSVIIRETDNAGGDGFRSKVVDDALILETEFPIKALEGVESFIHNEITIKRNDINLTKNLKHSLRVRYVYYNDFGAVGDGVAEDYPAIVAAHKYANQHGFTVCAGDNTGNTKYTYYIGNITETAVIKTNVNWGKATFYIDDKAVGFGSTASKTSIFRFESDYSTFSVPKDKIAEIVDEDGGLSKDVTKINYAPGNPLLLVIYNNNARQYMRYGHFNNGATQRELIVIDGEGNLIDKTGLLFDYDNVSSITAKRVDDKPVTASGGIFITDANSVLPEQQYYNSYTRNIVVERSNVTIRLLEHKIINEGETGVPYSGFISMSWSNNMLVEETILQGHKVYKDVKDNSWMGTYDIGGSYANGLYFKNCTQSNFFVEGSETSTVSGLWGIMGTNYCKNITYDNSTLSRLDAHAGVYNASIINGSKVQMINLIGGGTALIEDSYIYNSNGPIDLRADYGSLWNGDIILRDVKLYIGGRSEFALIRPTWRNHNFGYNPSYGERVLVENLTIMDSPNAKIYLYGDPTTGGNDGVGDITADRVSVPNTTNGLGDKEEKDKSGLYKNYNKASIPTEVIIVNMPQSYKNNFSISKDKFLLKAGIEVNFMTTEEYKEYLKNK